MDQIKMIASKDLISKFKRIVLAKHGNVLKFRGRKVFTVKKTSRF